MSRTTITTCNRCGSQIGIHTTTAYLKVPPIDEQSIEARVTFHRWGSLTNSGDISLTGHFCAPCAQELGIPAPYKQLEEKSSSDLFMESIRLICREEIEEARSAE